MHIPEYEKVLEMWKEKGQKDFSEIFAIKQSGRVHEISNVSYLREIVL